MAPSGIRPFIPTDCTRVHVLTLYVWCVPVETCKMSSLALCGSSTAYKKTVGGMLFQSDEDRLVAGHFNTGDVVVFENPTEACPRPKQLHLLEYEDRYQPQSFPHLNPTLVRSWSHGYAQVVNAAVLRRTVGVRTHGRCGQRVEAG